MKPSGEITDAMVERATAAVVKAHDDEIRAFLAGEREANVWRPEVYARAALVAALTTTSKRSADPEAPGPTR